MFFIVGTRRETKTWAVSQRGEQKTLIAERIFLTLFFIIRIPLGTSWKLASADGKTQKLSQQDVDLNFGIQYDGLSKTVERKTVELEKTDTIESDIPNETVAKPRYIEEPENNNTPISTIWIGIKYIFCFFIFILSILFVRNCLTCTFILALVGFMVLPLFADFLKKQLDFVIPRPAHWIGIPCLLFILLFFIDTSKNLDGTKIDKEKEKEKTARELVFLTERYKDLALLKTELDAEKTHLSESPCQETELRGKQLSKVDYQYLAFYNEFTKDKPIEEPQILKDWHWLTDWKILTLRPISQIKNNKVSISADYKLLKTIYDNKYLVVFIDEERTFPTVLPDGFVSGEYTGWLSVVDLTKHKIMCSSKISAENSKSVRVWSRYGISESKKKNALVEDLTKNFQKQLLLVSNKLNISLY